MGSNEARLREAIKTAVQAWRPPPQITVSEWAERFRVLSAEACAEPGPWRNARAPHLVQPMNDCGPYSEARKIVLKFSAQSAKTELILNVIGYIVDCDPGPILVVQPNVDPAGERFSKQRVAPMLRDSPTLAAKAGPQKSRTSQSTIKEKHFPGGVMFIGGANSPAGLASMPIRYFLGDEIDRWEINREGDALSLGRERLETYRNIRQEKEILTSTPTYDDLGISVEYNNCQRQYERHLVCDDCGGTAFPRLKNFIWETGKPRTVRYVCQACGHEHPAKVQRRLQLGGQWVTTKDQGGESVGYWMNRFASPFSRWEDVIGKLEDAGTDPAKRQVFVNTSLAEGWDGEGEKIEPHALAARAEDYGSRVPAGVLAITIGADVQGDRIEFEVVGWGAGRESWSLDYRVLPGEPTGQEVWEDLLEAYREAWETADGRNLPCAMMCPDASAYSQHVYEFVKRARVQNIVPIKGASGMTRDQIDGDERQRRKRTARRMMYGKPPEILGVDSIKRTIYHLLNAAPGSPGYCHFPQGRSDEYYQQITAERLIATQERGKRPTMRWVKIHTANEALDCRGYAYAALLMSGVKLVKPKPKPQKPEAEKHATPARPRWIPSAGGYRPGEW